MKNLLKLHLSLFIASICSITGPAWLVAAEAITSSGQAYITSSVNAEIFRTRAIENALQKIVLGSGQKLNSFSIVENGKVLLDHIQTSSAVKILQYDVIDEVVKNKKYHVTVKAVLGDINGAKTSAVCKKAAAKRIDFSIDLYNQPDKFPAWALISKDWVVKELKKYPFDKDLNFNSMHAGTKNNNDLYKLQDHDQKTIVSDNFYKLQTKIYFDRELENNFLEKSIVLSVDIKTILKRKNKVLDKLDRTQYFDIQKSNFNKFLRTTSRSNWDATKQAILKFLVSQISDQIANLNCPEISPRVFAKSGIPFIDYGRLDGIKRSDMFVLKTDNTKKTYLKILEIRDHETKVEIISQQNDITNINGKTVELVSGS